MPPRPAGPAENFAALFSAALSKARKAPPALSAGECRSSAGKPCSLCAASTTSYDDEVIARNEALQDFWSTLRSPLPLSPLVASPPGRHYRTVSKRKAYEGRRGLRLSLIDPTETTTAGSVDVLHCAIEPEHHAAVYTAVQEAVDKPYARDFAEALRYVVIKGNEHELTVILSVGRINPDVIRGANTLSRGLTHRCPQVTGVMLFEETGDGRYYLGSRDPSRRGSMKKIFGESQVYQKFGGKGFLFPALAFTQANASLVDRLIADARAACGPMEGRTLYDLYCGYGLFALTVGEGARQAIGIERSPEAIDAAIDNARRQHARFARFIRSDITAESLAAPLGQVKPEDVVVLDPPRSGTARGVVETIASKKPRTVIHLVCNIELLAMELKRWTASGYSPVSVTPYDMFPATNEVEIMVVAKPGGSSLSVGAG
jgi:23S rRNA (uracil1939-C5)-methyltransferase